MPPELATEANAGFSIRASRRAFAIARCAFLQGVGMTCMSFSSTSRVDEGPRGPGRMDLKKM